MKNKAPKNRPKKGRGGQRKNAGRKKSNPDTKVFGIRHSISVIEEVRSYYNKNELQKKGRSFLNDLKNNIPPTKQA